MYADPDYYLKTYRGKLDFDSANEALTKASMHIDSLTYNRIVDIGFENLTKYQQDVIKYSECMLADWETENEDYLNSILSNYSVNGASMSFTGNALGVVISNGVAVSRDVYMYLQKSGLCCRTLRGC